jgi:hypothetical protein
MHIARRGTAVGLLRRFALLVLQTGKVVVDAVDGVLAASVKNLINWPVNTAEN